MINPNLLEKAKAKGTDAEYQAWVRLWPSCLTSAYSTVENGVGRCVFAHVRRAAEAGTGYKPEYSGIPLTQPEHAMTHQKGESTFYPSEWYDKQAARYLTMWLNGRSPPDIEEQKRHWKREYIIESPGHMLALWLLLKKHFEHDKAPPVKCTLQRATPRRTNLQNSAQWSVLYDNALDYYMKHPRDLGTDSFNAIKFGVDKDFMHWMFKQLFNNGKSTAKLSTIESSQYAEKIRHHFWHQHQHEIPEPISYENSF